MNHVLRFILHWAFTALGAWLFMLCIGAAHHADDRIPALGWGACCWLFVALLMVAQTSAIHGELEDLTK